MIRRFTGVLASAAACIAIASAAQAQESPPPVVNGGDPFTALWHQSTLLGDMGGVRSTLGRYGISLGLQETSEVLGNVSGGVHQGAAYDGLTEMSLGIDLGKAIGLEGGIFNVSALQIHGRNLSADNLYSLQTASGIESNRATRLWELWYQQSLADGRVDVKLGQQIIDHEFMGSLYSGLFINTMMGWPMVPSVDLYAGGPAYPLSSLGVRLRAEPTDAITVLAGVFDDNPAGGPFDDDSQVRGAEQSGAAFNLNTGALFIAEVQYAINQPANGEMAHVNETPGLPGTYKLGAWYDTAGFPDQHYDNTGLSLADPNSSGNARQRRGNFSIYGIVDQMVWRPDPQGTQSVGVFARLMGAPGDRNLVNFSVNAGVSLKAPFTGRDNDTAGLGFGVAHVSGSASDRDRDVAAQGTYNPVRASETFVELTYQMQLNAWLSLQPDFQYVSMPSAGIANPIVPGKGVGNEAVLGLRTNTIF